MTKFDYTHPPGVAPLVSGGVPGGDILSEDLYMPVVEADLDEFNPSASLDVMNGFLDTENLEVNNAFKKQHLQPGSQSGGGQVGATANMDFFKDLFSGNSLAFRGDEKTDAELRAHYVPIPGAGVTFYLPYDAHVLFMWNIGWFNDGPWGKASLETGRVFPPVRSPIPISVTSATFAGFNVSQVQLFFDNGLGVIQDATNKRKCMAGHNNLTTISHLSSLDTARYWCGHKLVKGMAAGQHSAGLRMFAPYTTNEGPNDPPEFPRGFGHEDGIVQQTRVRVRSMRYIWFRPSTAQL